MIDVAALALTPKQNDADSYDLMASKFVNGFYKFLICKYRCKTTEHIFIIQ